MTMAGNFMGSMKKKLGVKGATKPGDMIRAMNKIKGKSNKALMIKGAI